MTIIFSPSYWSVIQVLSCDWLIVSVCRKLLSCWLLQMVSVARQMSAKIVGKTFLWHIAFRLAACNHMPMPYLFIVQDKYWLIVNLREESYHTYTSTKTRSGQANHFYFQLPIYFILRTRTKKWALPGTNKNPTREQFKIIVIRPRTGNKALFLSRLLLYKDSKVIKE